MKWIAGALAISWIPGVALAAEGPPAPAGLLPVPDYSGDLWSRSRLTGDWGGLRTRLADRGVQVDVDFTQYVQGLAAGGRRSETRYGGHFDHIARVDLMRMGVLPGALITVHAESRYGSSINGVAGPILPVNTPAFFPLTKELDEDVGIAITGLNYTQFLSEHLAVLVGKIDTLDADLNEFASGRGKSQFLHANFLFSSVVSLRMPYSTLGAAVQWLPTGNLTIKASIINTVDCSTTNCFNDFDDGSSASAEASLQYCFGGLPGGMNLGGLYSFDQDFAEAGGELILQPGQGLAFTTHDETWALYWSAWQSAWVEGASDAPIDLLNGVPDRQGVGFFTRLGIADQDTNPVEWNASGGIGGRGVIATRDDDVFGVGYYYNRFQDTRIVSLIGSQNHAQGFEAFYNAAITPAAHLTFDIQVQDSFLAGIDTAVILGARLNLAF